MLIMKYIAKAVISLLLVLKILKEYLLPMKHVNQMVTSHSSLVLQSPAICAVKRHTLHTTFSLSVLKVLLFFLPFPSLCLRKSKAIFFEQFKNVKIQSGYNTSVFSVGVKKMWN